MKKNPKSKIQNSKFGIIVHPENCTGCRLCEMVCSVRRTGKSKPDNSAIRVGYRESDYTYLPLLCSECKDASCVAICPEGALSREAGSGIIRVNRDACSSCGACMAACGFGTITLDERGDLIVCDLCGGAPECAKSCYAGALEYVATDTMHSRKQQETVREEEGCEG